MAESGPSRSRRHPPPLQPPAPAPTTITALGDDILCEIFLRLPAITSLARAAFTCRAFLGAVRSSPAFRRRFRVLHAPPLLALFRRPYMSAIVPAAAGKRSDMVAAFRGLLENSDSESGWFIGPGDPYSEEGYVSFLSSSTYQCASYSPHSKALKIYPKMAKDLRKRFLTADTFLEFYTLFEDGEEKKPPCVVCVHRDSAWAWACVAVFSSQTMEWRVVLPQRETWGVLNGREKFPTGTVVNGLVCWIHKWQGCIVAFNTATFQFSRMELPPSLKDLMSMFQLGQTSDGKLCVVSALQCMLSIWLWEADDEGVERFMPHKTILLRPTFNKITELSEEADVRMYPMAVINGFVYLYSCLGWDRRYWFLSFCLETEEMNLFCKESQFLISEVVPYIMVSWPSSLNGKEDSDTVVTGKMSEDDGPMGTEKASPVLFTAVKSFREQLIDDDNSKFAEIEAFLLDDETNSLLNRISTLESGLAAARDRVLRIGTEPKGGEGEEAMPLMF